jgi:hypothetical protein
MFFVGCIALLRVVVQRLCWHICCGLIRVQHVLLLLALIVEPKVSAVGWRRPRPSRQIPYTAPHSTLAEYVGVLCAVGDSVGSLPVIALILLRFK